MNGDELLTYEEFLAVLANLHTQLRPLLAKAAEVEAALPKYAPMLQRVRKLLQDAEDALSTVPAPAVAQARVDYVTGRVRRARRQMESLVRYDERNQASEPQEDA